MEHITEESIKQAVAAGSDNIVELFEPFFTVHEDKESGTIELETWTSGGVNMIFALTSDINKISEFTERVSDFCIGDEIDWHRQDQRYVNAFSIEDSVEDFTEFKAWLEDVLSIIDDIYGGTPIDIESFLKVTEPLESSYRSILEEIASDLAELQRADPQFSRELDDPITKFYDRMCANVTDFESLEKSSLAE